MSAGESSSKERSGSFGLRSGYSSTCGMSFSTFWANLMNLGSEVKWKRHMGRMNRTCRDGELTASHGAFGYSTPSPEDTAHNSNACKALKNLQPKIII